MKKLDYMFLKNIFIAIIGFIVISILVLSMSSCSNHLEYSFLDDKGMVHYAKDQHNLSEISDDLVMEEFTWNLSTEKRIIGVYMDELPKAIFDVSVRKYRDDEDSIRIAYSYTYKRVSRVYID